MKVLRWRTQMKHVKKLKAKLYQYVMNTRKNRSAVSMEMLQFEGCRLARKHNISISEFKVSYAWVTCFTARHDLTIRRRTMIAETTGSIRGKTGQFPEICPKIEKAE
jgi:hypothetical protein